MAHSTILDYLVASFAPAASESVTGSLTDGDSTEAAPSPNDGAESSADTCPSA